MPTPAIQSVPAIARPRRTAGGGSSELAFNIGTGNQKFRFVPHLEGYSDGGDINSLVNRAGVWPDADLSGATAATYKADAINGRGAIVNVTSTSGPYLTNIPIVKEDASWSYFLVVKRTGNLTDEHFHGEDLKLVHSKFFDDDVDWNVTFEKNNRATLDAARARHSDAFVLNTWQAMLMTADISTGVSSIWSSGAFAGAADATATAANSPYDAVDFAATATPTYFDRVGSEVAELVIWNKLLSAADRANLDTYILNQYGLS